MGRLSQAFQRGLLALEANVRHHPGWTGLASVIAFAALTVAHVRAPSELSLAVTYAVPLAVCTYSVGIVAGVVTAVAISVLWLVEALDLGLSSREALIVFAGRLVSSLGIVGVAAVATLAARAREHYLTAQQELMRLRTDLASAFAHDVRGPLTAISGYVELLRDGAYGALGPEAAEALNRIDINAARLNHLIGDMLVAGDRDRDVPITVTSFAPEDLVNELQAEFDAERGESPVTLAWHVGAGGAPLRTDRVKLASVVRNLVSNALKFTRRGSVTVRMGFDAARAQHRIDVEDTGEGIAANALPHIFDRFFRAENGAHTPGVGLGLFIVKRFTEVLGGSIEVSSRVGQGTRFTVMLPAAGPPAVAGGAG